MIQLPSFSAAVLPLCIFSLHFAAPSAQAADNLLPEGNMETVDGKGLPEGFNHPDPNWLSGFKAVVSVAGEEGNNFLRFEVPTTEGLVASTADLPVPEGAKEIRVAWKVRANVKEVSENTDQSGRGVCLIVTWFSEPEGTENRGYKHGVIDQTTESTDGWKDKEVTLPVPEGKKFMTISIGTKGTAATADFDDVVIEALQ